MVDLASSNQHSRGDSLQIASEVAFRHPLTGEPSDYEIAMPAAAAVSIDHAGDAGRTAGIENAFWF